MCSANKTTEEWLSPTSIISTPQPTRKWPEDPNVNTSRLRQMYDRWTYAYMSSILTKGSKQKQNDAIENRLSQEDLFEVPNNMQASLLAERFRQFHGQKFDESQKVGKNRRLFRTLWHLAAPTFIPAGFCQLMTVVCQVSLPLLVREVLRVLENNPQQSAFKEGIPFAIAIFLCTLINSFANHRHRHLAMKSGVAMRAGTVAILYDHVLRLSPRGKQGLTTGEVTNLIATDTQKLYEVSQEGHLLWALPLSIALVTLSLFFVIGPTCLVGVAVLILCVPLASRVTSSMLRIRHKRVKMTDKRVNIVGGMLQGIKVTKLNGYEENYQRRVEEARQQELLYLRKELAVWAMTLVLVVISPIIATASTFTVYVLVDENNLLTPSKSFSVLLLFSALRFPINFAGRLLGKATQAYSAVLRIARFLEREARSVEYMVPKDSLKSSEQPTTTGEINVPLELKNATFFINPTEAPVDENSEHSIAFQVSKFDFKVKKGEVLAVCGPVAAGKSSLINGIIDELPSSSETSISTYGRIAYVSQSPFILNATLRENILFGRPFDEDLYNKVIDACCLWADIELMGPAKDLVELGEHGRTISGGQQQRVSLARAAYAQPDLILLDDPLSALDAQTSKKVFGRLIRGPDSLLSNAAVVLVTHASHFLNRVDNILVIVDGSLKFKGSFESLTAFHPQDEKTKGAMEFLRLSIQENSMTDDKGLKEEDTVQRPLNSEQDHDAGKLILKEEREHGLSSLRTWLLWFTHAGGVLFLSVQICLMTLDRVAYVAVEYWLAQWSNSVSDPLNILGMELPPQKEGRSAQYQYLAIYSAIIAISVVATIMRSEWAVTGGSRAAKNVFSAMLIRVLGAPMYYFESTPIGRVLNRFTYDTEVIDVTLTQTLSMFMISCSWFVAGVTVMVCIIPWLAIPLTIITWIYWRLLLYYRCSGPDLQRLDALSRSPLQALLNEALDGAPTIRVYSQYATFVSKFYRAVDSNTSALLAYITSQRWLGCRIELLGTIIVLSATVLVISLNGVLKIDAGLAGLLILWSSNFTITLGFLVDTFSETEAAITAIERVDAMSCLPQEGARYTGKDITLPDSWPEQGELEFSNVSLRYRAGVPLALKDLSFRISPGERVGIVGRSGAGKSSITLALFRLVEIESGRILLDGVDLGSIGLADVRGRGMEIIPQNPFLVGGTLRECVDPFGQSNDDDILNALKAVRLVKDYDTLDVLNSQVEEGGFNFSVGERQLLNLARAMLSKPVLLCLDEATASIDGETDAFLQRMLRTKFSETTQITVAHRLETIMDFDKIIVMDYGCAAEIGSPKELLAQNGIFANLVDAAGPEGSRALRALVKQ